MPLGIYLPVLHLVQQNSKWAVKTESWKKVKLPKFTSKIAGNKDSQKVVNYRRNFKVLQNGRHFCKALVQSQFLLIPVICFISGYYLEGKFEHLGFIHLPTSFKHDTVSFYSLTISYLSIIAMARNSFHNKLNKDLQSHKHEHTDICRVVNSLFSSLNTRFLFWISGIWNIDNVYVLCSGCQLFNLENVIFSISIFHPHRCGF